MPKRRTQLIGLGAAFCSILLLAAGLHNVILRAGRPFSLNLMPPALASGGGETDLLPGLPSWFSYVVIGVLVALLIALIVSPSLRRDLLRNLPIYLLFMIGIYFIYRGAANPSMQNVQSSTPPPEAPMPQPDIPAAQVPEIVQHPPEWLIMLLVVLVLFTIATVTVLIVRRMRPKRSEIELIVDEAREALETLRAGGDLRDTITRAYAEMVNLFAEKRGQLRDRSLTPREFEQRLASAGLHDSHIRRLTRLFELVRYSPHRPGPKEEREAEECLSAIVAAYSQPTGEE